MTPLPSSFWTGGSEEYMKALHKDCEERLAPLKQALEATRDPQVRKDLEEQTRAIQEEFVNKIISAGRSLF